MHVELDKRPIIEPSPPHCVIVNSKTKWPDQMERAARSGAEPGNIAGVWWDFRVYQDDVKWPTWTSGP